MNTTLLASLALAAATANPPPVLVPCPAETLDGEINGTRKDLADFLRANRRRLKLRFFDKWGDPEFPIHSFVSLLERTPFREANGSRSCAMHFTIFPF